MSEGCPVRVCMLLGPHGPRKLGSAFGRAALRCARSCTPFEGVSLACVAGVRRCCVSLVCVAVSAVSLGADKVTPSHLMQHLMAV